MVQQSPTDPKCAKPTIRILLYTDAPNGITNGEEQFGLGPMIRHLFAHKPALADVSVASGSAGSPIRVILRRNSRPYSKTKAKAMTRSGSSAPSRRLERSSSPKLFPVVRKANSTIAILVGVEVDCSLLEPVGTSSKSSNLPN